MDTKNYLDFDLLIKKSETGYSAKVINSPSGRASYTFQLPFSEVELENFILRVGRTRRGTRRLESPEMQATKRFGGNLYETIFKDEVSNCLHSSLTKARQEQSGLRIRLRLSDAPELINVPWEYLYDSKNNRFLSLSVETPIVRDLDLQGLIDPLLITSPLRILVMISSPSDYFPLDVEKEWNSLKQAVKNLEDQGLIIVDRVSKPTLIELQRQLRKTKYHVFHFIGHGGFDKQSEDGILILEDEQRKSRSTSSQYIGTLLHDEQTIRLAVLNACEGARTSTIDPFAGVGQSLLQQGIPAVIAMQFEITDKAAITFSQEFYMALADGYPVDASLAEARKAIYAEENDMEWGTPVLYMRSLDGHIFKLDRKLARQAVFQNEQDQPKQPDSSITTNQEKESKSTVVRHQEEEKTTTTEPNNIVKGQTYTRADKAYGFGAASIVIGLLAFAILFSGNRGAGFGIGIISLVMGRVLF